MWEESQGKTVWEGSQSCCYSRGRESSAGFWVAQGDRLLPLPLSSALATRLERPRYPAVGFSAAPVLPEDFLLPLELVKSAAVQHLLKSHLGLC